MRNLQFILFILLKKAGLKRNHKILDLNAESNDILKSYIGSENYNPTISESEPLVDFIVAFDFLNSISIYELKLFLKNIQKICHKRTKIIISVLSGEKSILTKNGPYQDKKNIYFTIEQFRDIALEAGFRANHIRNPEKDLFPFLGATFLFGDRLVFILNKDPSSTHFLFIQRNLTKTYT